VHMFLRILHQAAAIPKHDMTLKAFKPLVSKNILHQDLDATLSSTLSSTTFTLASTAESLSAPLRSTSPVRTFYGSENFEEGWDLMKPPQRDRTVHAGATLTWDSVEVVQDKYCEKLIGQYSHADLNFARAPEESFFQHSVNTRMAMSPLFEFHSSLSGGSVHHSSSSVASTSPSRSRSRSRDGSRSRASWSHTLPPRDNYIKEDNSPRRFWNPGWKETLVETSSRSQQIGFPDPVQYPLSPTHHYPIKKIAGTGTGTGTGTPTRTQPSPSHSHRATTAPHVSIKMSPSSPYYNIYATQSQAFTSALQDIAEAKRKAEEKYGHLPHCHHHVGDTAFPPVIASMAPPPALPATHTSPFAVLDKAVPMSPSMAQSRYIRRAS
jgi:hypothetical protein